MRIIIRITRNNNYKSHTRVKVVHFKKGGSRHTDVQQSHGQTADIQTDRDTQTVLQTHGQAQGGGGQASTS